MAEQNELITWLKEAIDEKKQEVKKYSAHLDQNLSQKITILENLKNDVNEITKVDINQLNTIVDSLSIKEEEKQEMKKELDIIKTLLTLNQIEKTSYTLLPHQLTILNSFLENLENYISQKNQEHQSLDPEYNRIMVMTKHYKDLLSNIKNPNSNILITQLDTIKDLFKESNMAEEKKQAILLSLIKYNQDVIKKNTTNSSQSKILLTESEISKVFEKYNYDFFKLEDKYQKKLIKEGSKKNIEEVLSTMQKLNFYKLREKEDGLLLTTYLLMTTKKNLEEIGQLAEQKRINITSLEPLVCVFIEEENLYEGKYKIGRIKSLKKNLTLLTEHGINIETTIENGKEILLLSNSLLKQNLDWLECYGLYKISQPKNLLDDFLTALRSKNIPEIIDLWIENHSLGILYIKNNLSALSMYLSDQTLLFFKLYQTEHKKLNNAFRLTMSNGVKKLSLRKELTIDSQEYENIYDVKTAILQTSYKKPIFKKEKEYDKIAKESMKNKISEDIFKVPEIMSLNIFSDTETLLYNMNGLKISKLKVLRIYNALCENNLGGTLDALLYAICYNKIITEEEYNQLKKTIAEQTTLKEVEL